MKKNIYLTLVIILGLYCNTSKTYSQIQYTPFTLFNYGSTVGTIRGIGIGTWPVATPTNARLQVSNFYCNLPAGPLNGLLFRTDGNSGVVNKWQMFTGPTAGTVTEKGMIFNYGNNPVAADQTNFSLQATVKDMTFFTLPITSHTVGTERMRITGVNRIWQPAWIGVTTYPVRAGNVGIGNSNPLTMLQIGLDVFPGTGYRDWMNIGTLYYGAPNGIMPSTGTDNMYVGLRHFGPDSTGAIIEWGNNPALSNTHSGDRLLFVFTAAPGNGQASTTDGLETARMLVTYHAPNVKSLMGIGGDPAINLYSAGTADPQNTLEINSPVTGTTTPYTPPTNTTNGYNNPNNLGGTGYSGLRFTDLTSSSQVCTSGFTAGKVLSLDNDGDVILVPANTGFVAPCGTNTYPFSGDNEFNLNNHNFLFHAINGTLNASINNVGIGFPNNLCTPAAKLDVRQASGAMSTIGILVVNYDQQPISGLTPSIGIKSIMRPLPPPSVSYTCQHNVAGWFQAVKNPCGTVNDFQYALFVPQNGGSFSIGWDYVFAPIPTSNKLVFINGTPVVAGGFTTVSDVRLKKDTNSYHDGLNVIRKLKPMTYKFNGKAGIDTTGGLQIGLIAQQLFSISPQLVDSMQAKIDSTDTYYTNVYVYKPEQLIFTTINAVKQLDSITTGITAQLDTLKVPTSNGMSTSHDTVQLGGSPLAHNTELPLNNFNLNFTDPTSATAGMNQVNIGGNSSYYTNPLFTAYPSKLAVINPVEPNDVIIGTINNTSTVNQQNMLLVYHGGISNAQQLYGVKIIIDSGASVGKKMNYGLVATIQNSLAATNNGIQANVSNSASAVNNGINTAANNGTKQNCGIVSSAKGGESNYGGKFSANDTAGNNYGIYASANATGITANSWAGWFNGNVNINGDIDGSGSFNYVSDSMFKSNIDTIHNALNIINQLKPKNFYFDTTNIYGLQFNSKKQYGLIAQNVERILPELVSTANKPATYDSTGTMLTPAVTYKTLNYNAFIAIILKGMQEQQKQISSKDTAIALLNQRIDSLKDAHEARLDTLEAMINRCCNMNSKTIHSSNIGDNSNTLGQSNVQNVDLEYTESIILNQNDPNPFAEETNISYYLPDNVGNAKMMFYTNTGVIVKTVELLSKGNGTLHVYASNLSSGIYTYALVVDGKVVDSKQMVCTKK